MAESRFSPAINLILMVNGDGMVRSAGDGNDGYFSEHFYILRVVVFEEVSDILGRADGLDVF